MNDTTPRNVTRTFQVKIFGGWGDGRSAQVLLGEVTVELRADAHGQRTALVNGEPADWVRTIAMLDNPENQVTRTTPTAA